MADEPNNEDKALLSRLNALRKSHISLEPPKPSLSTIDADTLPASITADLTARFKNLHSKPPSALPPRTQAPLPLEEEFPDEQTAIEDLLADLGPNEQWNLTQDDETTISHLVRTARQALATDPNPEQNQKAAISSADDNPKPTDIDNKEEPLTDHEEQPDPPKIGGVEITPLTNEEDDDKQDEEEADAYLRRILDELASTPQGVQDEDADSDTTEPSGQKELETRETQPPSNPPPPSTDAADDILSLPTIPTTLPADPTASTSIDPEDAFAARFAALSLPSTPSSAPSTKKKPSSKQQSTDYTDQEIDSWCIICMDDGELVCLGCGRDVYCTRCWRETHGGMGEKAHRWEIFDRRKGGEGRRKSGAQGAV